MSNTITLFFTKKNTSIFSWLIRWTLPISRFKMSASSHCFIFDHEKNDVIEAVMSEGVRKTTFYTATDSRKLVRVLTFNVPDASKGLEFARSQVGKKYDIKGALGIGISPTRKWQEEDKWFCYELAAATLKAAGLDLFNNISHVSETHLFSINSEDISYNHIL